MGVVEIFRGMGKNFRSLQVCYFIYLKVTSNISALEVSIINFSDLWQQLELASELESDLGDTVDWGKKWLVDFNAGKT